MEIKKADLIVYDDWCENIELTEEKGSIIPVKIPKEVKKQIKKIVKEQRKNYKTFKKTRRKV